MKTIIVLLLLASIGWSDFINGGFEEGCTSDPFCLSDSSLPGWTIQGSVDVVNNDYWPSHSGSWSIDSDGSDNEAGSLSQDMCTVVGNSYTVTFYMSPNADSSVGASFTTTVSAGSTSETYTVTRQSGDGRTQYTQQTFTFVATATQTTVTIASQNPGNYGAILDDISISGNGLGSLPCPVVPQTAAQVCADAHRSDWTRGIGYYCFNGGFVECWNSGEAFFNCPAGTSCACTIATEECSNRGTESPCR